MLKDLPDNHQQGDIAYALSFVGDFGLALDCGAHRGIITRQLSKVFRSVVAVEPGPLHSRITGATVINAAVADKAGRCSMQEGTENSGQRHCIDGDDVEVITIDSLNLAPDFIKLDVEGMEYLALLGGEQTIKIHRPVIMLEENGLNRRYDIPDGEALKLLTSWGAKKVGVKNKDHIFTW